MNFNNTNYMQESYVMKNMIRQSKVESLIEALTNIGTGFILALCLWSYVIEPLYLSGVMKSPFFITLSFTVVSILRSYFWRRFFANRYNMVVKKWIGALYGRKIKIGDK